MIELPDTRRAFEFENNFYLTCDKTRLAKVLAQYELFKMTLDVPGTVVECGVFKGASLVRFAMMRALFSTDPIKQIIAFDTFDHFPETSFQADIAARQNFVDQAGSDSISVDQLTSVLRHKDTAENVELVAGDITETLPRYVRDNPGLQISLINLDTDVYEPAVTILKELYPRLAVGGVLVLDNYGVFPGETAAVDQYFGGKADICKLPFAQTPSFMIKRT